MFLLSHSQKYKRKPPPNHKTLSELLQSCACESHYATTDWPVASQHTQRNITHTNKHTHAHTASQVVKAKPDGFDLAAASPPESPNLSIFHSIHPSAPFPVANVWCAVDGPPKTLHSSRGGREINRERERERKENSLRDKEWPRNKQGKIR